MSAASLVTQIQTILGLDANRAEAIVTAFDEFVAKPLQANLARKAGRDLAARNPMIYTARGVTTVDEWVERALDDWETSAAALGADPNITVLGSDDFWEKISGIPDFRARLVQASTVLSSLLEGRAASEVARIAAEAKEIFGDAHGNLNLDVLVNPPPAARLRKKP